MKVGAISILLLFSVLGGLSAQDRGLAVVAREVTGDSNFDVGRQYAVIIGIDRYQNWMPLKNAVIEAQGLKRILADSYYIDGFFELYNDDATASNIRRLFSQTLPSTLGVHDSLLIFYAGHGQLDESKSGFWIPVDGGTDTLSQDRWIPNSQIRSYIGQLKAQRVLIMADSCFSGDLLDTNRGATPTIDSAYYKQALQLTARQVLSSGASEAVPDQSEFASELLGYLERNTEPLVDTLSIYERIRTGMTQTLPLFGTLPGNENGASFVLFHKPIGVPQAARQATPSAPVKGNGSLASVFTLHIRAESEYKAWVVPADRPEASPIAVTDGSQLSAGNWVFKAQLPDDVEASWNKQLLVSEETDNTLTIPALSYSRAYQVNVLDHLRSLLVTELEKKESVNKTQKVWGWISLVAGAAGIAAVGYGWMDGNATYSTYATAMGSAAATARTRLDHDTLLLWSGAGLGGVGISVGSLLMLSEPASADRAKVKQLDEQITRLKEENTGNLQ
jgi:hypothetical protein